MLEQGVVQELHIERASARGLVGNIYLGRVARVLPGMQSAFVEIGLERAAFLHIADIWEHRQNGHGGSDSRPIEKILHEGQSLLVQVIKDPIGTKGARLSTQVSLAGPPARLPAAGLAHRHLAADRGRGRARDPAREAPAAAARGPHRRLHHPHDGGDRHRARDAERHRVPDQALARPEPSARAVPAPALLYQDLTLAQRVLRDMATEETARVVVDSRETFVRMQEFAREYTPALVERIEHYAGERPLFDLASVEDEIEKALGAPRRPEVRRLPDRRPDRGDDDDRRQHRRLRRRPQLRRHDLQDEPRGGAGDRAAAAAAQPRRHHHHRLHRHGERRPPQRGARRAQPRARARPHAAHRQRLHAAGPGRDDAQAHARVARARAVRALPDLPAAAASSRPRRRSATRSCARSCARRSSSTRASSGSSPRSR